MISLVFGPVINDRISADWERLTLTLRELASPRLKEALRPELNKAFIAMVEDVKYKRMSGQLLGVRSGRARRSMAHRITAYSESLVGEIYSDDPGAAPYVAAHEQGFHGYVNVRGFVRRFHRPQFRPSGKMYKTSQRKLKGVLQWSRSFAPASRPSYSYVRPHQRYLDILAKRFIQTALQEGLPNLSERVEKGLARFIAKIVAKTPTKDF